MHVGQVTFDKDQRRAIADRMEQRVLIRMTNTKLTRREILNLALASPLIAAMPDVGQAQGGTKSLDRQALVNAPSPGAPVGADDIKQVELVRQWRGPLCRARLINRGKTPARIKEVTLFDLKLDLPATTTLYGEGFQMLSQTGGEAGRPVDLGNYTDAKHYRCRSRKARASSTA